MHEGEDDFIVGMAVGIVICVVVALLWWAITGGPSAPVTVDNCPVEYKTK